MHCEVCDDATHTPRPHFGAMTCQGCASFFRRSLAERKQYQCQNKGACNVKKAMRVRCRACRLKRCVEAGMRADTIDVSRTQQSHSERPGSSAQIACGTTGVRAVLLSGTTLNAVPHSCSDMFEQENLGAWSKLQRYVNGIRAYYNAERSMYSVEHPSCVFDEPKYGKIQSDAFVRLERLKQPLVYNMVSEHFMPLESLSSADKKRLLRRFSNGFTEMYAYWLTIKVFPEASGSLFVTHYGQYMDCEDLEDFFDPTGAAKDKQIRLLEPIVRLWSWTFNKFKALRASPTEMSALIALWLFLTCSANADKMGRNLSRTGLVEWLQIETTHSVRLHRQTVLDELMQYLSSKEDSRNAGIRLGQLLLFLSELTELMAHYNDYAVMGRVFLAGEFTCVWDVESHSAEETSTHA